MISVVVCTRQPPEWSKHHDNVAKTIGVAHEYIRFDNRSNAVGICAAYNSAAGRAQGEVIVFVHDDVFFLEPGWGERIEQKFVDDASLGVVGLAGSQYLLSQRAGWVSAGRPFIQGKVLHEMDNGTKFILCVYSWLAADVEVVAVDGLFLAVRRELFSRIKFDESVFNGFHFYDLDICMQVREQGRKVIVTDDVLVKHLSGGSYDEKWWDYAGRFVSKYHHKLPATCTQGTPDLSNVQRYESFDISSRMRAVSV